MFIVRVMWWWRSGRMTFGVVGLGSTLLTPLWSQWMKIKVRTRYSQWRGGMLLMEKLKWVHFNHSGSEIFLYKPGGYFQFEIIINVLVSSFCSFEYLIGVRFRRLISVSTMNGLKYIRIRIKASYLPLYKMVHTTLLYQSDEMILQFRANEWQIRGVWQWEDTMKICRSK